MFERRVKHEKRSQSNTYRFADPNETGRKRASIAGVQPEGMEIWPRRVFPPVSRGFPIFPGRNVGRWVGSLQTIRSKIFTANPHLSIATRFAARGGGGGGGGAPDARNGRGLLAETHKPIRLPSNLLELRYFAVRENILRRPDVYLRSGLYLYFRVGIDSRPGY